MPVDSAEPFSPSSTDPSMRIRLPDRFTIQPQRRGANAAGFGYKTLVSHDAALGIGEIDDPNSASRQEILSDFLERRTAILDRTLAPEELREQTTKLTEITQTLNMSEARKFLEHPYVVENLEFFFKIDPKKIKLALEVGNLTSEWSKKAELNQSTSSKQFESQFAPAINLGAFTALDFLEQQNIAGFTNTAILEHLERMSATNNNLGWGQRSLIRHIRNYLKDLPPNLAGDELKKQLVFELSDHLHQILKRNTEEREWLGQSQGIEIEVLKYVKNSKLARARGVDTNRWLPRGVPIDRHIRKDWNLLPLLGINEDIGERAYQVFEMSTNPTETMAAQTSIIFELMQAGFITEEVLSSHLPNDRQGRESFSLHVSTVFPKGIVNKSSLREYQFMARALAGAYASDQRISFGGFMSGGAEIADKSAVGNLKKVEKKEEESKTHGISPDLALIEVRSLDLTLRDQYPALLNKEFLDFAFRCAWEKRTNPSIVQGPVESYAADQWTQFLSNLDQLYTHYGISPKQLYSKYGPEWEQVAWKEVAAVRDNSIPFKTELAGIIRTVSTQIRASHRDFMASNPASEGSPTSEKENKPVDIRFLSVEPLSQQNNRIYLTAKERNNLGLRPGQLVTIKYGDRTVKIRVAQAKVRGDYQTIESTSKMRFAQNVLDQLGIRNNLAVSVEFSDREKTFTFGNLETYNQPTVKFRTPRTIRPISSDSGNTVYFSELDQQRLNLKLGEELFVRVGSERIGVKVAGSPAQGESTTWSISQNVTQQLGITSADNFRAQFDKTIKELSFGPTIAVLKKIKIGENGEIVVNRGDTFVKQLVAQAKELGAFACIVDVNAQDQVLTEKGFVEAYVLTSRGKWVKRIIPKPDVCFDRDSSSRTPAGSILTRSFNHQIIPTDIPILTGDKLFFAHAIKKNPELTAAHPKTATFTAENLEQMLRNTPEVIIKPQFGQRGAGIFIVKKIGDSYSILIPRIDSTTGRKKMTETRAASVSEVLDLTKAIRNENKYIVQEKAPLTTYSWNSVTKEGRPIRITRNPELRIALQRDISGNLVTTGIVTRLIDPNLSGTEYEANPLNVLGQLFPDRETDILNQCQSLAKAGMRVIENGVGKYSGELVFDFGLTTDGRLVLIEANSKAETRSLFADPDVGNLDAAYHSTLYPLEYSLHLTDMN